MFTRQYRPAGQAIGDDLDREFDEVYHGILSSKGVRTDEEELALLNELIRRAEQGSFPEDGSMHIISPRVDVDWTSDEAMLAVRPAPARNYGFAAGGALIAVAVLFAFFSMMGSNRGTSGVSAASGTSATATAMAAAALTETLAAEATQTAMAQATAVWAASGIVVGSDYKQKLPPVYPETLELDGVPFRVYPSAMQAGRWSYQKTEGTASWIGGTVINWSFGIPALGANMQLFQGLGQAQDGEKEALVRMSGGAVRHFRLEKPVQIDRQQIEVFIQNRPGLTLVLLGDEQGAKRWLIRGTEDYTLSGYGAGPEVGVATPSLDINQLPGAPPTHPVPQP
ncbi:MAG: hypothetical protein IVW55_00525 [Chloroflexi bacterium]|nr:hypothetical protein [Chloroflexota bacterium]